MVFFHQEGQVEADYDDQISRQPVEPHDLHQVFNPVSYTHLDVYKRQPSYKSRL